MAQGAVTPLYAEVRRRFPEVRDSLRDDEGDYAAMRCIFCWLQGLDQSELTPDLVRRIVDFSRWCEDQPRGATASDDILTVLVVVLYEKLFESEVTRSLLPHLLTKDDLLRNAEYYRQWVGAENYELALKEYNDQHP